MVSYLLLKCTPGQPLEIDLSNESPGARKDLLPLLAKRRQSAHADDDPEALPRKIGKHRARRCLKLATTEHDDEAEHTKYEKEFRSFLLMEQEHNNFNQMCKAIIPQSQWSEAQKVTRAESRVRALSLLRMLTDVSRSHLQLTPSDRVLASVLFDKYLDVTPPQNMEHATGSTILACVCLAVKVIYRSRDVELGCPSVCCQQSLHIYIIYNQYMCYVYT